MTVLAVMPGKKPRKMELEGSLESMQAFVGGVIQAIYPFEDPVAIVCNEKVPSMTLSAAPFSYAAWERGDFSSLPEDLMETYFDLFACPELFVRVGGNLPVMRV